MLTFHSIARLVVVVVAAAVTGCASPQVGHVRFHNQLPITEVNDRKDVPKPPTTVYTRPILGYFDSHYHERLTRWMEMRPVRRAENVNSIDEVPNSTWFTNRIGVRELAVDELRIGPNVTGSPEPHLPFVVKSSKPAGRAFGLIVADQRGKRYILKFDPVDFSEVETGADPVSQRIMWAAGYHVPEDYVVHFKRTDLVLTKKSVVKDDVRGESPMTEEFLDELLKKIYISKDGTIRGLASLYLDGVPVGGHPVEGVRADDPNDRTRNERRRERRGLYTFYSWIDLTDIKEDNTLDMYVEDPADKNVHYVMHYLVDFGKSLGAQARLAGNAAISNSYAFDTAHMARSLLSLGLWRRPWESKTAPKIVGVGLFDSATYVPHRWKPNTPNYFPFLDTDRFDGFWAAKIIMRFTPAHIRAAVEQGRYSDPRAVEYITRTLLERQRKTVAHYFGLVAPLDRFVIESNGQAHKLCFDDLAIQHQLAGAPGGTSYALRAYDVQGRAHSWSHSLPGLANGRACTMAIPAAGGDGYTIIHIEVRRPGKRLPPVLVHVAKDPATGTPRVIGLRRE